MTRHVTRPTMEHFATARRIVSDRLWPTPLLPVFPNRYLKLENLQPTGSFKVRGALNAMAALPPGSRVVTASAGNHALGVAWAARTLGVAATIVVAETASPAKIAKLRTFGIDLILHGTSYDDAEAHALELAADGATFLSPYNDPVVIAGQATVLDELVHRLPEGELNIFVPLGGGGLLAGIAMRAAELDRSFRIVGVEAAASTAASHAVHAGHVEPIEIGETLADGLAGNIEAGSITVDIIRECGVALTTVTEDEIRHAIHALYQDHGVVAEGSAAVAYAAMQRLDFSGIGIAIITGRNIAFDTFADIVRP